MLVVIGHNWSMLQGDMRAVKTGFLLLYSFHMPAFCLLSGYFSRSFSGRPDQIRRLVSGVLLPYLCFELLYTALYSVIWHTPFRVTPTTPTYLCWFLLALFIWRITAPLWRAFRHPVVLAVLISLAAGTTVIRYELALPRVLQFLPWFVIGLQLTPRHFALLRRPWVRWLSLVSALGLIVLSWWLAPRMRVGPLLMQFSYHELHLRLEDYLVLRMALFAAAAIGCTAFFAWVPRHRAVFTTAGAATMYPYLLHGLLVKTGEAYGFYRLVAWAGLAGVALLTMVCMAVTALLVSPPVRRATRWLVEPRMPQLPRVLVLRQRQLCGSDGQCVLRRAPDTVSGTTRTS